VFALPLDASGTHTTAGPRLLGEVTAVCSINEDAQGELYATDLSSGQLVKIGVEGA
jgi:hypothetical protein